MALPTSLFTLAYRALMPPIIRNTLHRWRTLHEDQTVFEASDVSAVLQFHRYHDDFRTPHACVQYTGVPLSQCIRIKQHLYATGQLGAYFFEEGAHPQIYMQRFVEQRFPHIRPEKSILEVGPGDRPIFPPDIYQHSYAVDKYFRNGSIHFGGNTWARDLYPANRIFRGDWDGLAAR